MGLGAAAPTVISPLSSEVPPESRPVLVRVPQEPLRRSGTTRPEWLRRPPVAVLESPSPRRPSRGRPPILPWASGVVEAAVPTAQHPLAVVTAAAVAGAALRCAGEAGVADAAPQEPPCW